MSRDYGKQPAGGVGLRTTKVKLPRANPLGTHGRPRGFESAKVKSKNYSKTPGLSTPAFNVGFGDTGLTGES